MCATVALSYCAEEEKQGLNKLAARWLMNKCINIEIKL